VITTTTGNFQALEAICSLEDMDVVTVEIAGFPGYGFFVESEYKIVVDYLVNNGLLFSLYCLAPITNGTQPPPPPVPESSPESLGPRGRPDGACS
jgi:hypothetical protein